MLVLILVVTMIAIMEGWNFINEINAERKEMAQRNAVFNSFYEADRNLKYLK
jgi:hypothetical protein